MSPKKGKEHIEPFVKLENRMTNSAAWTSLSVGAVWVYIELRKSFNPRRGGNSCLVLPYSEVQWKMNARTYRLKKQELIDKGFIRVVDPGGLYKRPSVYELSNEWERISLEIVDKEGKEAIKFRKKTYPQKLPPGLRNSIEEKKKRNEKQYMEIY